MMITYITKLFAQSPADGINLPNVDASDIKLKVALSIFFAIMGAVSVLMVTIAGFRYILGQGDPQSMNKAKNTIVYALIGLFVSASAFLIINVVLGALN